MPIYSLSAAGGAAAGGVSGTGAAAGARAALGAGGFFAAGTAACAEAAAGARGAATFAAGAAWRVGGSGFMMLTGGVDEALGNSALVGLPVGIDGGSPATAALAGNDCGAAGAFQVGA
jgi:hypothetical protein